MAASLGVDILESLRLIGALTCTTVPYLGIHICQLWVEGCRPESS